MKFKSNAFKTVKGSILTQYVINLYSLITETYHWGQELRRIHKKELGITCLMRTFTYTSDSFSQDTV